MSSIREKRDKGARRLIIFEAVVIALLFHAALLSVFRLRDFKSEGTGLFSRSNIMVTPSSLDKHGIAGLQQIIEYRDPRLIAKPNRIYGAGAILPGTRFVGKVPEVLPSSEISFPVHSPPAFNEFKSVDFNALGSPDSEFYRSTPLPQHENADNGNHMVSQNSKAGPQVILANGMTESGLISSTPAIEKIIDEGNIVSETVVKIIKPRNADMLPRLRLVASCGEAELDRFAMRSLMLRSARLAATGSGVIRVEWRTTAGKAGK